MPGSIVQISGHIIDSLILPKVLDLIISLGGEFKILDVHIGQQRSDRSAARIQIEAPNATVLERVLAKVKEHGAVPEEEEEQIAELGAAPADGVFPDHFYATTNLPTWVRLNNTWIEVGFPEMDCGIRVDPSSMRAECTPVHW